MGGCGNVSEIGVFLAQAYKGTVTSCSYSDKGAGQ